MGHCPFQIQIDGTWPVFSSALLTFAFLHVHVKRVGITVEGGLEKLESACFIKKEKERRSSREKKLLALLHMDSLLESTRC